MQGKALQAKERLLEGWRATTTRFGRDDDDDDWSAKQPQHSGRATTDTAIEGASTGGV